MDIEWTLVWPLLGVMVLAILITGPGLWSDAWGHWWVHERKAPDGGKSGGAARRAPR